MKKVAEVQLSKDRSANVYYQWEHDLGDTLTMRIQAVTEEGVGGLSRSDQLALLDVVKRAIDQVR